jgi:transketolase
MDVGIIACGPLVHEALKAAQALDDHGVKVAVLNMATVKPLDTVALEQLLKKARALVTVEEHQAAGGLGSAVAEYAAAHAPTPIEFVAVHDRFGQSGKPEELLNLYNLNQETIEKAAYKVISRK